MIATGETTSFTIISFFYQLFPFTILSPSYFLSSSLFVSAIRRRNQMLYSISSHSLFECVIFSLHRCYRPLSSFIYYFICYFLLRHCHTLPLYFLPTITPLPILYPRIQRRVLSSCFNRYILVHLACHLFFLLLLYRSFLLLVFGRFFSRFLSFINLTLFFRPFYDSFSLQALMRLGNDKSRM